MADTEAGREWIPPTRSTSQSRPGSARPTPARVDCRWDKEAGATSTAIPASMMERPRSAPAGKRQPVNPPSPTVPRRPIHVPAPLPDFGPSRWRPTKKLDSKQLERHLMDITRPGSAPPGGRIKTTFRKPLGALETEKPSRWRGPPMSEDRYYEHIGRLYKPKVATTPSIVPSSKVAWVWDSAFGKHLPVRVPMKMVSSKEYTDNLVKFYKFCKEAEVLKEKRLSEKWLQPMTRKVVRPPLMASRCSERLYTGKSAVPKRGEEW